MAGRASPDVRRRRLRANIEICARVVWRSLSTPDVRATRPAKPPRQMNRREALKELGAGAAALALPRFVLRLPNQPLVVAGQLAELSVSSVSPMTVRLT